MKKKILIVDDEKLILFSLVAALENDSVAVTTAVNGGNALAKAADIENCNLCIVDLYLPDMKGLDLIPQLKELHPDSNFIIITGKYRTKKDFLEHEKGADAIGPFAFLTKPFDFSLAQQLVREALADH
ncbi:MAG: response regulator [Pseudomonadota bacterium]